ncbi:hypothetical protein VNO77_21402 [Canavalia gladiata]|uniref:Uncharacterized protein n=1 Tax=Canavalia gladiata TaxID=3824 RepID=A0AAN9LR83_CANGL
MQLCMMLQKMEASDKVTRVESILSCHHAPLSPLPTLTLIECFTRSELHLESTEDNTKHTQQYFPLSLSRVSSFNFKVLNFLLFFTNLVALGTEPEKKDHQGPERRKRKEKKKQEKWRKG